MGSQSAQRRLQINECISTVMMKIKLPLIKRYYLFILSSLFAYFIIFMKTSFCALCTMRIQDSEQMKLPDGQSVVGTSPYDRLKQPPRNTRSPHFFLQSSIAQIVHNCYLPQEPSRLFKRKMLVTRTKKKTRINSFCHTCFEHHIDARLETYVKEK